MRRLSRKILPVLLLGIEIIAYIIISDFLDINDELMINSGILYFLFMFIYGHYSLKTNLIWNEIKQLCKSSFCFFIALLVLVPHATGYERRLILAALVASMFCVSLFFTRTLRVIFRNHFAQRTLIIGIGAEAARLGKITNNNRFALTKVIGYINVNNNAELDDIHQNNVVKEECRNALVFPYHQLDIVIRKERIDQVMIAVPEATKEQVDHIMEGIYDRVESVKYLPNVNGTMTFNSEIQDFDGILLIATSHDKLSFYDRAIKRAIDIVVGLLGVILLLPIGIYVKIKTWRSGDHNPIIFTQERLGMHGKSIKIYKFRSMIPDAEEVLEKLMSENEEIRDEYLLNKKLKNDPRVTEVGEFLRKTSLDEFPQFINVLKGEMSFVGPRPYLFREIDDMGVYYESIIECKPGITGMWQANGRSDVGFDDRCKLDDYYYRNWSIWLDLTIIYKTIKSVVYGKGSL
ncbi:MAG: exopolysaccharide biosynthesis polyprenyl glycosylphosphotransferase [Coprobacillaceae bacterium]